MSASMGVEMGSKIATRVMSREKSTEASFGSPERVEWHLWNWSKWMRSGANKQAAPRESSGLTSGGASQNFDDMVEAVDRRVAATMNVIIDDLPPAQSAAVHHEYLHSVYRFPRGNFAALLAEAKLGVGHGLAKKGVW